MNDKNLTNLEDRTLANMLESAARQVEINPSFKNELEKKIMNTHKPKVGFGFFSVKKVANTLGWTIGLAAMTLMFIWVIRAIAQKNPSPAEENLPPCNVSKPGDNHPLGGSYDSFGGISNAYGSDMVWTQLASDGITYVSTENQMTDGSYSIEWLWWSTGNRTLTIQGHRLDGNAPPLRVSISPSSEINGARSSTLIFPTTGCWEVNALLDGGNAGGVNFITEVVFSAETHNSIFSTPLPIIPTPGGDTIAVLEPYIWNKMQFLVIVPIPDLPAKANIYLAQPDQLATIESASALALQFGIKGQIYVVPGELPNTKNFMVTAGGPRIYIRSDNYFSYYRDYGHTQTNGRLLTNERANIIIDKFLKEHGFNFEYKLEHGPQIHGIYYVIPLLDGLSLRHDSLTPARLEILLDEEGIVWSVKGALLRTKPVGSLEIRSAKEAFQQILNNTQVGVEQNLHSNIITNEIEYYPFHPSNEKLIYYGEVRVFPSAEANQPPLITINDYTAIGNIAGLENSQEGSTIEASGQFLTENDAYIFKIDSWKYIEAKKVYLSGILYQDGEKIFLSTPGGAKYLLANIPFNTPSPIYFNIPSSEGQLYINGILLEDRLEWTIMKFVQTGDRGGGAGDYSFYKLNLTGTPIPLPAPVQTEALFEQILPEETQSMDTSTTSIMSTMTIKKIELVYYISDPRYQTNPADPGYIQPMWRFYGHYYDGSEFEFLVQALKDEFLLPEIQTIQSPD